MVRSGGCSCAAGEMGATLSSWEALTGALGGFSSGPVVPVLLYDRAGSVVGVENADILTPANLPHFADCGTPGVYRWELQLGDRTVHNERGSELMCGA